MNNVVDTYYDAIVIGTGVSGGWAAKELCEKGLKTLVLERGHMVEHIKDYPTAHMKPWDFKYRGIPSIQSVDKQHKQDRTGFVTNDSVKHWFVNDLQHPYNETKRFDWIRGYHVGGRSITWGRQALRMTDLDFEANKNEGIAVDWPIRYKDLKPWYDKVEQFIGVSGENLGLDHFPDGKLLPPMPLNCVEDYFKGQIKKHFKNRHLTIGRFANLTGNSAREGRASCMYRNRCMRGCPTGGYFSSNASTLPAANNTGNMTLLTNAIVSQLLYNDKQNRVTAVKVIDAETKEESLFKANIIFCCASTVGTTSILMQSKSKRFPNGLGNDSGELGHNLMDHHFQVGATATIDGFEHKYYKGQRPGSFHIPRFRNLRETETKLPFLRGYSFQGSASRTNWRRAIKELSYGKDLKDALLKPGPWKIGMSGFGECLPYHDNKMTLDYNKLDDWGLPTVTFDCEYKTNELLMREDIKNEAVNMLKLAGFKNVKPYDNETFPGIAIHEMGTARMGNDPKTSVLNRFNQLHAVPNVYVTDGACMTSSGNQNPSLTYMALTARAVEHAVKNYKKITNNET